MEFFEIRSFHEDPNKVTFATKLSSQFSLRFTRKDEKLFQYQENWEPN